MVDSGISRAGRSNQSRVWTLHCPRSRRRSRQHGFPGPLNERKPGPETARLRLQRQSHRRDPRPGSLHVTARAQNPSSGRLGRSGRGAATRPRARFGGSHRDDFHLLCLVAESVGAGRAERSHLAQARWRSAFPRLRTWRSGAGAIQEGSLSR